MKREQWISFRANEEEAFRIELAAGLAGVSRSAFIRSHAVQEAEKRLGDIVSDSSGRQPGQVRTGSDD